MISVERSVGRLLESRIVSPFTVEELRSFEMKIVAALTTAQGPMVSVLDLRRSAVVMPEVGDKLVELMRRDSGRLIRSAFVLGDASATMAMQVERMVREAGAPHRKCFHKAADALVWLGEVTTSAELEQATRFLSGGLEPRAFALWARRRTQPRGRQRSKGPPLWRLSQVGLLQCGWTSRCGPEDPGGVTAWPLAFAARPPARAPRRH